MRLKAICALTVFTTTAILAFAGEFHDRSVVLSPEAIGAVGTLPEDET